MYCFRFDADTGLLSCKLEGFWAIDEARRYCRELESHADSIRRDYGRLLYLVDCTDLMTQAQDVQHYLEQHGRCLIGSSADRTALVTTSTLTKRQAQRILPPDQLGVFDKRPAAKAWLEPGFQPPPTATIAASP